MIGRPLISSEKSNWIQDASVKSLRAYNTHETNLGFISKRQSKSTVKESLLL